MKFTAVFAMGLYGIHLAEVALPGTIWTWAGILPRTSSGLLGVLFAPLLHGSWGHLMVNTGPLLVLLVLLFMNPRYRPWSSLAALWILSGLGTWLIGRGGTMHIGASGLIYALVAFLIVAGWRLRQWFALLVAAGVVMFYGGLFLGAIPWLVERGVSWEGHLMGAVAGILVAARLRPPEVDPVELVAQKALAEADRLEKLAVELNDPTRPSRRA